MAVGSINKLKTYAAGEFHEVLHRVHALLCVLHGLGGAVGLVHVLEVVVPIAVLEAVVLLLQNTATAALVVVVVGVVVKLQSACGAGGDDGGLLHELHAGR